MILRRAAEHLKQQHLTAELRRRNVIRMAGLSTVLPMFRQSMD